MADSNKIKYGVSNVHVAKATIGSGNTASYDTPVALPGAVSLSLSAQGDTTPFYADNIEYYTSVSNAGYEGDLTLAYIPDSFWTDFLGYKTDANGVIYEDADSSPVHFALMFEFQGDAHAKRCVLYNCVATRPNAEANTKEDSIAPQTEQISLKASSIYVSGVSKNVVKASVIPSQTAQYNGWNSAVYQPSATTA